VSDMNTLFPIYMNPKYWLSFWDAGGLEHSLVNVVRCICIILVFSPIV
jgi:hypothetical protein